MDSAAVPAPLQPLVDLLREMRSLIDRLDDIDFAMPAPGRSSGGVGGHVRHCLDHLSALLAATHTGVCAYDRRSRGTDVETNRRVAMRALAELTGAVQRLDPSLLDREIEVETQLDRDGTMITTRSSIGRELVFITSHTVHHNAIVAMMLHTRGISAGPYFGMAPSTPNQSGSFACAR